MLVLSSTIVKGAPLEYPSPWGLNSWIMCCHTDVFDYTCDKTGSLPCYHFFPGMVEMAVLIVDQLSYRTLDSAPRIRNPEMASEEVCLVVRSHPDIPMQDVPPLHTGGTWKYSGYPSVWLEPYICSIHLYRSSSGGENFLSYQGLDLLLQTPDLLLMPLTCIPQRMFLLFFHIKAKFRIFLHPQTHTRPYPGDPLAWVSSLKGY